MDKSRWSVLRKKMQCIVVFWVVVFCVVIVGCAPTRIYSVDMNYSANKAAIPAYLKTGGQKQAVTIAIAEFVDTRKVDDRLIIGRVIDKDGTKTLIMPKYIRPTQAVAAGIREYLIKAGYKVVRNVGVWDLKEGTIPDTDNKFILGGNIEELELSCRKGFPTDTYKARIKISIVLADAAAKKILYRMAVESNTSLEHVSFSEERLEKQINSALREAIEKIFEDKNFAQKLI
jgi:hypothetical protein